MLAKTTDLTESGAKMAGSVVNLDALIPREDMLSPAAEYTGVNIERIGISNLDDDFFGHALRKPDFQRETAHWSPEKVSDLVRAFASGDLIPAVIVWRPGTNIKTLDLPVAGKGVPAMMTPWANGEAADAVSNGPASSRSIPRRTR